MYLNEEKKHILYLALNALESVLHDTNNNTVSPEAFATLRNDLETGTTGYVVLNHSVTIENGATHDFLVLGDGASTYGRLEHAASVVEELLRVKGNTWETLGVYAVYPVPVHILEPLITEARCEAVT